VKFTTGWERGSFLFPRFRSGISVYSGSKLSVFPNQGKIPLVTNNSGPGILLDVAAIGLLRGIDILSNAEGFVALNNSTAEFIPEFGVPNRLEGNAIVLSRGGGGSDLRCDNTSVLVGDFTGVSINNCSSTGGDGRGDAIPNSE